MHLPQSAVVCSIHVAMILYVYIECVLSRKLENHFWRHWRGKGGVPGEGKCTKVSFLG